LVLPCRDVERSLSVYRDVLGFAISAGSTDASVDLDHVGANGGGVRLVPTSGASVVTASLGCAGPYGMTLYTTKFESTMNELSAATGYDSISIAYTFPGTETLVREGTVPGPDGINIFLVEHDPARHRCCIGNDMDATVSEIAAVGFVVDDLAASIPQHEEALGATVYMDATFGGKEVERLNALEPGSQLHVAFLRGSAPGNARVELLERIGTIPEGRGRVDGVRVICRVPSTVPAMPVSLVPGALLDRVEITAHST
jgi:catechol 2,3-dioxygenase-like lactoylglutathione lyase family enzyme